MNYASKIQESIDYLLEQERKSTLALLRDRVRFIRLLKSGEAKTQSAAEVYKKSHHGGAGES